VTVADVPLQWVLGYLGRGLRDGTLERRPRMSDVTLKNRSRWMYRRKPYGGV